jgi:hypothetical protein
MFIKKGKSLKKVLMRYHLYWSRRAIVIL